MNSLIEIFHLDWKLFLAQLVNFAIVFGVLYFFVFKKIFSVMGTRSETIAKSLADAKKNETLLADTEIAKAEVLKQARHEAAELIAEAQKAAEIKRNEAIMKAKEDIGQIISAEREKMQQEKVATLREIKAETAELVIATVEKVLGKKETLAGDKDLIKKLLKEE